jgi:hypothetical protein
VHEEEVDVVDYVLLMAFQGAGTLRGRTVADDESLVAGGHQVAGLLVGSVTDLSQMSAPASNLDLSHHNVVRSIVLSSRASFGEGSPYLGHSSLALEPPADAVVDTLRLAP